MSAFHRSGHADVVQSSVDRREDLGAERCRRDVEGVGVDQLDERVDVVGEPEEPVRLGDDLEWVVVFRTSATDEIGQVVELFAAHAIGSRVVAPIQIAAIRAGSPQPLNGWPVPGNLDWCG